MDIYPNKPEYKIIKKLGQGAFGAAYKVMKIEDNSIYVIKRIEIKNAQKKELESIKKEAQILSKIKSEYVVRYYDSFQDKDSFNIIMEFCDGLDLRNFINEHRESKQYINESLIFYIILHICLGLKEIHDQNLIHRDLKPDNLFISGDNSIKIGDFGISKQLQSENEYAKTQTGTMIYMAPEIINGEKYNNKVDIWSLGCIIHELCTLNYCFHSNSIRGLITNISESNHERINEKIYSKQLQNLIDLLLIPDYKKRPDIKQVIKYVKNCIKDIIMETMTIVLEKDEAYQNYLIEKNIEVSLDQIHINILKREYKYSEIKEGLTYFSFALPLNVVVFSFLTGGLGLAIGFGISLITLISSKLMIGKGAKQNFILDNINIIRYIENKITESICSKMKEKITIQKIIVYDKINFEKKIQIIKNRLISPKYIVKLRKIVTKNFNILLVGCTNAGKSTLINEFLKLEENKKAKESEGGPTDTVDFTPYKGQRNGKEYTLYDTNGITNEGKDSIQNKIENTLIEIDKRVGSKDPNKLIHCIWYCFQGSNIQPSDANFIKKLLEIYSTYSIPIIFVHTQTYSKKQSSTCKKGIEKYLKEIYKNDNEVEEYLNNYINILARGDEEEEKEAFGLDDLEKLTKKEIQIKGIKSAYFELIKRDISPILINGAFNLIFTEKNIKLLSNNALNSLEKFIKSLMSLINDERLGLSENIKKENKITVDKIYEAFKNFQDNFKDELKSNLTMKRLKKDNEEMLKEIYEDKPEIYKKKNSFSNFSKKVEDLIYDNISHRANEMINNILNQGFSFFMIECIKEGIKEQLKEYEKDILEEIYVKIFEENNN